MLSSRDVEAMIAVFDALTAAKQSRVAETMREQDLCGWLKQVHDFMTASGARCLLEHVPTSRWVAHFAANEDAYSAVVAELEQIDG